MGGDLFALVHAGAGPPVVLNAAGPGRLGRRPRPPAGRGPARRCRSAATCARSPCPAASTAGWRCTSASGGCRSPSVLAPAIGYAADGFPASPLLVGSRSGPAVSPLPAGRARTTPASTRPGSGAAPGRGPGARGDRRRRPGRLLRRRVRRRPARPRRAASTRAATWTAARPHWVDPLAVRRVGPRRLDRPAAVAGLPDPRRRWIAGRLDLPGDPDDPAWATRSSRRRSPAGHDRPERPVRRRRRRRPAGPRARSTAVGSRGVDRGRSGRSARSDDGGRRHDLPVHGRRRRHGRVAHPVERGRFGIHLFEPAPGSTCTTAASASPSSAGHPAEYGARPPPAAHAVARARHPAGRRAARRVRHDGWRRPAADPAAGPGPAARLGPVAGAGPSEPPLGAAGTGHGLRHVDGRTAVRPSWSRRARPPAWADGLLADRGHAVARAAGLRQRLRARQPHRARDRRRFAAGAADPRAGVVPQPAASDQPVPFACARRLELLLHRSHARCRRPVDRRHGAALRQRLGRRVLPEPRRLGQDRRPTRLRHDVAHRAPLPVRGLRGAPQPHPVRAAPGDAHRRACGSGRCSTSCRSGIPCDSPRTSRSPTSSPAGEWSSASAGAPSRARHGRSAPWSPAATTPCRPSTIASTVRSSKSRWRSSSWPGHRSGSRTAASTWCSRPTTYPIAARWSHDLTLVPRPLRKVDIYQPVTSPETDRVRARRRAQGRLLAAER